MESRVERWLPIEAKGYEVSDMGNVRRDGNLVQLQVNMSNGYRYVDLRHTCMKRSVKVARLVLETFVSNPDNKPCVDHINTIRTDDRLENLRWCTRSENMRNPITRKHCSENASKEKPSRRKTVLQLSKEGEFIREWDGVSSFCKFIGKNVAGNIVACLKGRQPSAYGYKWKYKED